LVLASWVWTDDRDRAEQAGCDAFLQKPCLPEKLTSELRRLLLTRRLSRPAAAKAHGERRSPHRPYHGQHAICPGCGSTLIFCDRFVLLLADESHGPGWLCENADCAYRAGVRRPEPAATADRHRRPRALIAGSDEARRTRFRAALHALHWQTQETIDGRDALAKALADNPDVLVVDERLAGLDALSLCELVKRDENARSIRLLLVADTPSARARLRAKEIGIDELVTSSVSSKLLRATFLQMIAGAAPGRPKRSPSPAKAGRLARPSKAKRVKSS
jgi:CheY-like chemotaxis protein